MKALTKLTQENISPAKAHSMLIEGNERFVQDLKAKRNLQEQVVDTSTGQYPFAVILSCIDSRVPAEIVFDQGIGDIFSVRVAGNVVNEDILGSIEYACKVAGSKIVVVMGHSKCGAVTAACEKVELGNITCLLDKIKPAVDVVENSKTETSDIVAEATLKNIELSIDRIRKESSILADMEKNGAIKIVGAMYEVSDGKVSFL